MHSKSKKTGICSSNISTEVLIQTESIDKNIWTVLIDFEKYSEWNGFTPKVEIIPDSHDPKVGDKVILHIKCIGSSRIFQSKEVLKEFDIVRKR